MNAIIVDWDEPMMSAAEFTKGFSLVELSIVLVILGLLVGGVLGGRSLIEAAELRAVSREYEEWQTAIMTFKLRYNALPGDMENATEFWGRADNGSFSGQCSNPGGNQGTGTQTCNGDGNGAVGDWDPGLYYEAFRVWQHLSNAGLIPGRYTGIHGSGGFSHHQLGVNSPASRYPGGGWAMENLPGQYNGDNTYFRQIYGNYLEFGGQTADTCYEGPFLTPEQAWNIDRKSDDGMPGRGFVYVAGWQNCTTATATTQANTAQYRLTNTNAACSMIFRGQF